MNFHKLQLIVLLKIQHFHIQFATSLLCGLYVSNVYDRILVFYISQIALYLMNILDSRMVQYLKVLLQDKLR